MEKRVVITGIGVVTSNGIGKKEFVDSLINGVSGLRESQKLKKLGVDTCIAGEIKLGKEMSGKEKYLTISEMAIKEAYEDADVTPEYVNSLKGKGIFSLGSSNITSVSTENFSKAKAKGVIINENLLCDDSDVLMCMCKKMGISGDMYLTNTACASGTAAAIVAYDLIKEDDVEFAVVAGVDILNEISIVGFNALQTLSKNGCKPFDKNRNGISLGEAAAFLVVEELESAKKRNAKIYAEIIGTALSNDAYHNTSPDVDGKGAYYCMSQCLREANISVNKIGYINAHGTGTLLNDNMELLAIKRLFGTNNDVSVSSTKSMLGHCLGAAGGVELAASILTMLKGVVAPSISINQLDEQAEGINIIREKNFKKDYEYFLSNSFAFGGNCASILIKKYDEQVKRREGHEEGFRYITS